MGRILPDLVFKVRDCRQNNLEPGQLFFDDRNSLSEVA